MSRLRVGVYNLYWSTYGGGEQVAGAFAQALGSEHDVTLLGPEPVDTSATTARLGVDLTGCSYQRVVDDEAASAASAAFDVFVNCTYLSTAHNRAPLGLYYVHFPQPPVSVCRRAVQRLARVAADGLGMIHVDRLDRVRRGFDRRAARSDWTHTYTTFLANSAFTADWVTRLWKVPAEVLHPPVRPEVAPGEKAHLIASVGRFFDPMYGHCKKQLDLVAAFPLIEQQGANDWRLVLIGGADAASREYALAVRRAAVGHAVEVHFNAPRALVRDTLAAASIFWHAGGYGEDPETHPDRFEHFGIAVVEAMAAGAVPVVFGAAGPAEIVHHGVDGYHWHNIDELVALTRELIDDPAHRQRLAAQAQARARDFTYEVFAERVRDRLAAWAADRQVV